MNASVITHILSRDPYTHEWFQGFSSPDLPLPKIKRKPALFVLNTDDSDGPGEHWCVALIRNRNNCEFFDSYGLPPSAYNFESELLKQCKHVSYNEFRVQGTSPTCGHHCLFYALKRARGLSSVKIYETFYSLDLERNDRMVYNFIKKYGDVIAQFAR
jgi:hypothetical protein